MIQTSIRLSLSANVSIHCFLPVAYETKEKGNQLQNKKMIKETHREILEVREFLP